MSSKMRSLQAALSKAATPASLAKPSEPDAAIVETKKTSRDGKVHIGAYLPGDFKRSLRLVQAQTGEDAQTLFARALNELFRAHNVPVVGA